MDMTSWWDEDDGDMAPVSLPDTLMPSQHPGVQSSWDATARVVEGIPDHDGSVTTQQSSASKSHSMAEKRRRDRINAQLASLRKLIPNSDKMDKAALLGRVIDQVKDLKRKASEMSKTSLLPTETDEVVIDLQVPGSTGTDDITGRVSSSSVFIRASVCCDDRPELFGELTRVLQGMKLTTVRADMTSVGGRIRSILVLCSEEGEEGFCVSSLKQSLRMVLSRIASSAAMASGCRSIRSKRQRFFLPC